MVGIVEKLESFATLDGDGIRYAIFFSGCPLRCAYCHNPETWTRKGTEYTKEVLAAKVIRFRPYFKKKGGVTLTGGEPLLQAPFLKEFLPILHANDINLALDTSGAIFDEDAKMIYNMVDTVIMDLKFNTESGYQKYANGSLNTTLAALDYLSTIDKRVMLRTVIVPGINDTFLDIDMYADIALRYPNIFCYELLGFHTMGFNKYTDLNIFNPLEGKESLDTDKLLQLRGYLEKILASTKIS